MNLQENINRIQSMMGVISENALQSKINKMIDEVGLYSTVKFFGGLGGLSKEFGDNIKISNKDKINFIKEFVNKVKIESDLEGISLYEFEEQPILYYEDKNVIKQIEYLYLEVVTVDVYHKPNDAYMRSEDIPYEELSDETLNDVFLFVFEIMEDDLS